MVLLAYILACIDCASIASQVEQSFHLAEVLSTLFLCFLRLYLTCSFLLNVYQASIYNILEVGGKQR